MWKRSLSNFGRQHIPHCQTNRRIRTYFTRSLGCGAGMLCDCRIVSSLKQSSFPTTPGASASFITLPKDAKSQSFMILYGNNVYVLAGLCDRLLNPQMCVFCLWCGDKTQKVDLSAWGSSCFLWTFSKSRILRSSSWRVNWLEGEVLPLSMVGGMDKQTLMRSLHRFDFPVD